MDTNDQSDDPDALVLPGWEKLSLPQRARVAEKMIPPGWGKIGYSRKVGRHYNSEKVAYTEWLPSEVTKLVDLIESQGLSFASAAKLLPGRTKNMVAGKCWRDSIQSKNPAYGGKKK